MSLDYRRTPEYTKYMKGLKRDYPELGESLLEYAILAHKMFPQKYKEEWRCKRPRTPIKATQHVVDGITVLDAQDIPAPTRARVVDK